jgi:tRNA (mo5U34)-methyltransferase
MLFQSMQRGATGPVVAQADHPFAERDLFDAPGWPKLHFIEGAYAGDPTNWWAPNAACAEAMLRSAGFTILSSPGLETYHCRIDGKPPSHPAI